MIERTSAAPLDGAGAPARHVAIIMDGNRRWAQQRGLSRAEGHRAGADVLRTTTRAASRAGIEFLTVFAFSEENWRRDPDEIAHLMDLLCAYCRSEQGPLAGEGVRVRAIGRLTELPEATRAALASLEHDTAQNGGLTLSLAVNYSARTEMCDAVRALAKDVACGKVNASSIDGEIFASYLYTAGLPDPDLLIRTGGELRVSNFLLYQIAYTELWSTRAYWPDFDESLLREALGAFASRQRRFGT